MEEIKSDSFKIILLGAQDENYTKLVKSLEREQLKVISVENGGDWIKGIENKSADVGIIIVTQDNFFFALNHAQSVRKINKDIPLFAFATVENAHFLTEMEEQGFDDHFFIPLNTTLFMTKLKKWFSDDDFIKRLRDMVAVPADQANATVEIKCDITSVEENGITFKSSQILSKGAEISIPESDILYFLGTGPVSLVIERSWPEEEGVYKFYAEWKSDQEKMAAAVRKWGQEQKRR